MKVIKVRGWNKKHKLMVDFLSITPLALDPEMNNQLALQGGSGIFIPFLEEIEVMQYTGLKDKNGKEIYEGDILKDDIKHILEVKFGKLPLDKSGACVCSFPAFYCKCYGGLGRAPQHECQEIGDWMEIIGNIYENPELLPKVE